MSQRAMESVPGVPKLDIRVTQAEIDMAVPANSGHCMVADAVKRCYYEKYNRKPIAVSVDLQTIRFGDSELGARFIYLTPVVAQRGLLQFDQGIQPTPFRFRLSANGAQIVKMITRKSKPQEEKRAKARTEKQKEQSDKNMKKMQKRAKIQKELSGKARVSASQEHVDAAHTIPDRTTATKIGGKAPPRAVLTGNRRQFGIRAAGSLEGPTMPEDAE